MSISENQELLTQKALLTTKVEQLETEIACLRELLGEAANLIEPNIESAQTADHRLKLRDIVAMFRTASKGETP